ncbi:MAG: class I SAM-dependent methyltransferase [Actinomycetota bacterium]|nr:class I SAM-dependent methyltransferase [Actinomycetota bacterium]
MTPAAGTPDDSLDTVAGWFHRIDRTLFRFLLGTQRSRGERGDLAELGVFQGQSAILLGDFLADGETFTVVDLFEDPATDPANRRENDSTYDGLTQQIFENQYLRFHRQLPTVVRGYSSTIVAHAQAGTHRFVHVDASHLYAHVQADIVAARTLLAPNGLLVLDDIRTAHAPGVAAAAWGAVLNDGLRAVAISEYKLYCTWGDAAGWVDALCQWLPSSGLGWECQEVAGRTLVRTWTLGDEATSGAPRRRSLARVFRAVARRLSRRAAAGLPGPGRT